MFVQLVLTRSSPIIFANYSLVENQRISSIAAVYSPEFLLFVAGDKVQQLFFSCFWAVFLPILKMSASFSCWDHFLTSVKENRKVETANR